jgi:hypothetical protein
MLVRKVDESKISSDMGDAADGAVVRHERTQSVWAERAGSAGVLRATIWEDYLAWLRTRNAGSSDGQHPKLWTVDQSGVEGLFRELSETVEANFLKIREALEERNNHVVHDEVDGEDSWDWFEAYDEMLQVLTQIA